MSMVQPKDIETTVQALLDAAQLRVSDEELALFVKIYPTLRAGGDSLYLAETRYEDPALMFDPAWTDR